MKAVESFVCTGVLPTARTQSVAARTVPSSVRIVRATSTSFMSGTGLKKWSPSTWAGRRLAAGLDEEHRAPGLRRDLDDAAAHEAAADDAHVLDGHDVAGGGAASSCGRGDPAGTVARNAGRPAGTGSAP